jgi:hypothetical protein
MRKSSRISVVLWLGLLTLVLDRLLDVTLVTTNGTLETATVALSSRASPALAGLILLAAMSIAGCRLWKAARRTGTRSGHPQATPLTLAQGS